MDRKSEIPGLFDQSKTRWAYPVPPPSKALRAWGLTLEVIGHDRKTPSMKPQQMRKLRKHLIMFVTQGRGTLFSAPSGVVPFKAPAILLFFPGTPHRLETKERVLSQRWIAASGPILESYEQLGLWSKKEPVIPLKDPKPIDRLFRNVKTTLTSLGPLAQPKALTLTLQLINQIVQRTTWPKAQQQSLSQRIYAKLKYHQGTLPQVSQIAKDLNVSYPTLRRQFKNETGQSVKSFLLNIRLNQAKDQLVSTTASVAEIAHKCGFEDPFYFSRLFKKHEGQSPKAYRNQFSKR